MKIITSVLLITFLANAHDHDNLFDLCSVTGCVACEPGTAVDVESSRAIGVWLQPTYRAYSLDESGIPGFFPGHEGERPHKQGIGVDHTEFYWSANKADQLRGSAVIAIAEHEGETEIEFEEAYIETLNSYLLPDGVNVKLGRAFWTLGSLNAQHSHSDNFADRPLPYRVFLDKAFNDDGAEISYQLPIDMYAVIGAGSFKGNDFPYGGVEEGQEENNAQSAYIRVGNKIDENSSWRAGAYMLSGDVGSRQTGHEHDGVEETYRFSGESDLSIFDVRYAYNALTLTGEYFSRSETGDMFIGHSLEGDATYAFDDVETTGWYVSAVYELNPKMRAGVRYSKLGSPDFTGIEDPSQAPGSELETLVGAHEGEFVGNDPTAIAYMIDWNHSDNSLIRFQINQEEMNDGETDDQFLVQYIMNL
ncbi:MAG: hypothetical protein ACJ0BW_00320 [Pontiellaceae bacterium]